MQTSYLGGCTNLAKSDTSHDGSVFKFAVLPVQVENVNRWACGRPQARLNMPAGDSDGEDIFQDELNLDALNGDFASNTGAASGAATGR